MSSSPPPTVSSLWTKGRDGESNQRKKGCALGLPAGQPALRYRTTQAVQYLICFALDAMPAAKGRLRPCCRPPGLATCLTDASGYLAGFPS